MSEKIKVYNEEGILVATDMELFTEIFVASGTIPKVLLISIPALLLLSFFNKI